MKNKKENEKIEVVEKDSNKEENQVDFLVKVINEKEYKLQLKYKNLKYLKARFGFSMKDFDQFDSILGEILYSAVCESDTSKRDSFSNFEDDLNAETIEYLFEVVEELLAVSFPNKFGEISQNENAENENVKKK